MSHVVLLGDSIFDNGASSTKEALSMFAARLATFARNYRTAIDAVSARGRAVTVCTIYNGALDDDTAAVARAVGAIQGATAASHVWGSSETR